MLQFLFPNRIGSVLWDTLTGVFVTIFILGICVVIIVLVSFFPPARRLARGPEGERLRRIQQMSNTRGTTASTVGDDGGWDDVENVEQVEGGWT